MKRRSRALVCSNCFQDVGLRLAASAIGYHDNQNCARCGEVNGAKLDKETLLELAFRFFEESSVYRTHYGAASAIKFNEYHYGQTEINTPEWLKADVELIESLLKVGFFYYGPRLWTLGHIEPLEQLQSRNGRKSVLARIVNEYPTTTLAKGSKFYRLRRNPKQPSNFNEYDSPPRPFLGSGRLDSKSLPVLYGSQDLEVCVHECRVTVEDELYFGTLALNTNLSLLDLTEWISEEVTEFESLSIAVDFLFRAPEYSYEIIRTIAREARNAGFNGVLYPSYYSQIHRTGNTVKNIALFGRPIKEKKLDVVGINRLLLRQVSYGIQFGPVIL